MRFWGGFRCFSKNQRVPKHVFLKLTGAMAPVASMLTTTLLHQLPFILDMALSRASLSDPASPAFDSATLLAFPMASFRAFVALPSLGGASTSETGSWDVIQCCCDYSLEINLQGF